MRFVRSQTTAWQVWWFPFENHSSDAISCLLTEKHYPWTVTFLMRGIEVCPSTNLFSTVWKLRSATSLLTIYNQISRLFTLIGMLIVNHLVMMMKTTGGVEIYLIILINGIGVYVTPQIAVNTKPVWGATRFGIRPQTDMGIPIPVGDPRTGLGMQIKWITKPIWGSPNWNGEKINPHTKTGIPEPVWGFFSH